VPAVEVFSSRKALAFALAAREARARCAAAPQAPQAPVYFPNEEGSTFNAQGNRRAVRPTLSLHRYSPGN
jgi:hypothetical protein